MNVREGRRLTLCPYTHAALLGRSGRGNSVMLCLFAYFNIHRCWNFQWGRKICSSVVNMSRVDCYPDFYVKAQIISLASYRKGFLFYLLTSQIKVVIMILWRSSLFMCFTLWSVWCFVLQPTFLPHWQPISLQWHWPTLSTRRSLTFSTLEVVCVWVVVCSGMTAQRKHEVGSAVADRFFLWLVSCWKHSCECV